MTFLTTWSHPCALLLTTQLPTIPHSTIVLSKMILFYSLDDLIKPELQMSAHCLLKETTTNMWESLPAWHWQHQVRYLYTIDPKLNRNQNNRQCNCQGQLNSGFHSKERSVHLWEHEYASASRDSMSYRFSRRSPCSCPAKGCLPCMTYWQKVKHRKSTAKTKLSNCKWLPQR